MHSGARCSRSKSLSDILFEPIRVAQQHAVRCPEFNEKASARLAQLVSDIQVLQHLRVRMLKALHAMREKSHCVPVDG